MRGFGAFGLVASFVTVSWFGLALVGCEGRDGRVDGGSGGDGGGMGDASMMRDGSMTRDGGGDAGFDAGQDGGDDAGVDASVDAGLDGAVDGGGDGGPDGGGDGGTDGGTDGGACAPTDSMSMTGLDVAHGTTVGAPEVIAPSCGVSVAGDVTFLWTAPRDGTFTFDLQGSDYDTVLSARDATCAGPELDCNDDAGTLQSRIRLTLTSGAVVVLDVTGYDTDEGNFILSITESPESEVGLCTNGLDDDRDGNTDCDDYDCDTEPSCVESDCTNGIDDDGDGATDCADYDCDTDPACVEINCSNGIDDDGDGYADCDDYDCSRDPACAELDCANGVDDDGDGAVDCADYDCEFEPGCYEVDCYNGFDDDGDGAVDCADSDCWFEPGCSP